MHWYVLQILSTKVFYTFLCRLHLINLTIVKKSSSYKRNNSYKNTFLFSSTESLYTIG